MPCTFGLWNVERSVCRPCPSWKNARDCFLLHSFCAETAYDRPLLEDSANFLMIGTKELTLGKESMEAAVAQWNVSPSDPVITLASFNIPKIGNGERDQSLVQRF